MRIGALLLATLALGLGSCGDEISSEVYSADNLEDPNAELVSRVEELEQKLETARTAAAEVASETSNLKSAIDGVSAEHDSFGGIEIDLSGLELAHSSLESSVEDMEAAVSE